ncbi:MAG: ABC transporter substrate-binding protein [Promethearchaeota archaeon]
MGEDGKDKFLNVLIYIAIIANIAIFSVFANFVYFPIAERPKPKVTLKVGSNFYNNPVTMDPCDSWDSDSNNMLDQVVETLIAYDLSKPDLPIIGRLAESWYWTDNVTITFLLRENVFFHDGSKFNATSVLHTFSRINYFGNWSRTLPPTKRLAVPHTLYKFSDGTPIINDTLSYITNEFNVSLVLNAPFGPIESLLICTSSSIVHPETTPINELLNIDRDLVIGTGPFKLIEYIPDEELRFERWERYWRTGAYWDEILFIYYPNIITTNNALLSGEVDTIDQGYIPLKQIFKDNPDITISGDGINDCINGSYYGYITFNSEIINRTWRKAISYAFNYTYVIHSIYRQNTVVKANSLVPPNFPSHNSSVSGAHYDIPLARSYIQQMGFGVGLDRGVMNGIQFIPGVHESAWKALQLVPELGNFINGTWNFRHIQGNYYLEHLIERFTEDMDLIGIDIAPQVLSTDEFLEMGRLYPDKLHIYYFTWIPKYFEAFDIIDPLVNPSSSNNYARINNSLINALLASAVAETNTSQRYMIYKTLQSVIIDREFYHMPLEYSRFFFAHVNSLKGFPYNKVNKLYFYPTYWEK